MTVLKVSDLKFKNQVCMYVYERLTWSPNSLVEHLRCSCSSATVPSKELLYLSTFKVIYTSCCFRRAPASSRTSQPGHLCFEGGVVHIGVAFYSCIKEGASVAAECVDRVETYCDGVACWSLQEPSTTTGAGVGVRVVGTGQHPSLTCLQASTFCNGTMIHTLVTILNIQ